jgi:HK97 family phage prohead protease
MDDNEQPEIIKREVGEKVQFHMHLEKGSTKELDADNGILEAVVTTSGEDRHREQIVTDGIDTSNYIEKNPVVLYGHDYWGFPIGKTIKLKQQKNKITARFQLAIEEYDFAKTVYNLVKGGYLNAVSIGGIVRKWSEDYRTILEMEMLEFSIVSIPANPDAMITARSFEAVAGKSMNDVRKEFEQFSRVSLLDKVKHMPEDEVKDAVKVLENLTARLKESAESGSLPDAKPHIKRIVLRDAAAVATQSQKVIKTIKVNL